MSLCRPIVLLALSAVAVPALAAEDFARVVASMPVIQAVTGPQQVCTPQQVTTPGSKSGAGAVIGAIAGGALGNQVGKGGGRAVATGVGLVGGALEHPLFLSAPLGPLVCRPVPSPQRPACRGHHSRVRPHGPRPQRKKAAQPEGSSAPQTQTVQQCSTHNVVENRVTGYSVTFEYAGKQYTTQMAQDPGAWIRLALVPVGGSAAQPVSGTPGAVSPSAYR